MSKNEKYQEPTKYYGIYINSASEEFWKIICPCGVVATYPMNGIPDKDTLHPCGNPDHWSVKYGSQNDR